MSGGGEPPWVRRLAESPGDIIPVAPAAAAPRGDAAGAGRAPVGILNIDKPAGITSHDVVSAVRRASRVRRVGHAGTLDPMATGVLVVAVGPATRVLDDVQSGRKAYEAVVRLGVTTSSYDAEGEVVATSDIGGVTRQTVESALAAYRGPILQVPPMHSAVRHAGKKLYELARRGIEVEREPRPVVVHDLRVTEWSPPDFILSMTVSAGTYVRSLAHDLGADLGVGAHLAALRRTAVGRFRLADAVPLERAVAAFAEGWWDRLLQPIDAALLHLGAIVIGAEAEADVLHGRAFDGEPPRDDSESTVRAYTADGRFVAVVRWDDVDERWLPDRVFPVGP